MNLRLVLVGVFLAAACGSNHGTTDGGNGNGDGIDPDAVPFVTDAPFGGMCTPGGAQCSNCIDDDGDMRIDGFDPQCTGPIDNDEATFATGIPGDNKDAVMQDCFFDGDSGAGNDGCNIHVCCLLGAHTKAECPIGANKFDPNACPPPIGTGTLSQKCIDTCGKLAPPGCDCFGCCTICDPANPGMCYDIDINPAVSPGCTAATLSDPNTCKTCVKNTQCGNGECGGTSCILCPGQDPGSLDPGCNGAMCPVGQQTCDVNNPSCPSGEYCSNGCCIGTIQ
jgi:hypothetical protein